MSQETTIFGIGFNRENSCMSKTAIEKQKENLIHQQ